MTATKSPSVAHHSWLEISGKALRKNYQAFCSIIPKEHVAPVLKSNAYGHDLALTYKALQADAPTWLCTNYVSEAVQLRNLGFSGRLLVMGPTQGAELADAANIGAEVFLTGEVLLSHWLNAAARPKLHIKIDSGMSRQGFLLEELPALIQKLSSHKRDIVGVCTHFANVEDVLEHAYADSQVQALESARAAFVAAGFQVMTHAASSASALLLPQTRYDLSRIGISLYGFWPSQATRLSYAQINSKLLELTPALVWKTRVSMVKKVKAGQFIGYGCTYRANSDMRVAVLPVGYFEGYPRLAGNGQAYVLLRGKRCAIVGRLCMNMMMVDVTHVAGAASGDIVTLIGKDGDESLSASDVAAWAQSIHYELVTRINAQFPRILVD